MNVSEVFTLPCDITTAQESCKLCNKKCPAQDRDKQIKRMLIFFYVGHFFPSTILVAPIACPVTGRTVWMDLGDVPKGSNAIVETDIHKDGIRTSTHRNWAAATSENCAKLLRAQTSDGLATATALYLALISNGIEKSQPKTMEDLYFNFFMNHPYCQFALNDRTI